MNTNLKRIPIAFVMLSAMVAILVALCVPCSALDYSVGSERQIANISGPATDQRGQTAIAAGADKYLAVWRDHRAGDQDDIYGAFIDKDGKPVGEESFLITCDAKDDPTPGSKYHPSVAFNGTNFLVVWDAAPDGKSRIYGARVTPAGQVLDPNGFEISANVNDNQSLPMVAGNDVNWQVVWQLGGLVNVPDIATATISGTNRAITKRATVASTNNAEITPAIAWNGLSGAAAQYLIVWEEQAMESDIKGCRINNLGTKIVASDVLISNRAGAPASGAVGYQYSPRVTGGLDQTGNPGGWMVVWEDAPDFNLGSLSNVRATRLSGTGVVQDAGGLLVFSEYGKYNGDWNFYNSSPDVAWNGQAYQVVCRHGLSTRMPWGRTVSYGGSLGTAKQLSTTVYCSQNGMGVAGKLGTQQGSVLAVELNASANIWGCSINTAGTASAGNILSIAKQNQQACASVWNGSHQVVVWEDKRSHSSSAVIYAARLQSNGEILDSEGVVVSPGSYQSQPAIAWSPQSNVYLVVWRQGTAIAGDYEIKGRLLDSNLSRIGNEITIGSYELDRGYPAVVWNGSNFTVVWADNRPIDGLWDIYGARVSPAGSVTSTFYVSTAPGTQTSPSIAAGTGGNCMVAWQDRWVMRYEYAIGTTAKGTNIRNWTVVPATSTAPLGTATEVTVTGLNLVVGTKYYISIRAKNREGNTAIGSSDGITIVSPSQIPAPNRVKAAAVPSTPVVIDDGDTQTSTTTLHATWSSFDNFGEPAIMTKIVPNVGTPGAEKNISTTSAGKFEPKIAFDGTNYLVLWTQGSNAIRGALVNQANNRVTADPAGEINVTTGSAIGSKSSLAWDGEKYIAAWEERRNNATTKTDIYAARISADGTVQDGAGGLAISVDVRAESSPFVTAISSEKCFVYYTNYKYSLNRLRAREFITDIPAPPEYALEDAKQLADGTPVTIPEIVVTAGNDQLSGVFYVEDKSRIQGIKVVWGSTTISEGMTVKVIGALATVNGERQINATSVTTLPNAGIFLVPFGVRLAYMGGAASGLVPGVVGGFNRELGANNVGLLVKCWGFVQNAGSGYFEINEGLDSVVRVKTSFALPTVGQLYAVTGISSCEEIGGKSRSLLLVRKASDVQKLE